MRVFLTTILLLTSFFTIAQEKQKDDDHERIPKSLARKVKSLTRNDTSELEKVTHISNYLIRKKRYDLRGFEQLRFDNYPLARLWRSKYLLCREYTRLFQAMCKMAGIDCYIAEGYTKGAMHYPMKRFYWQEHEWNIVKTDGQFRIIDLVWAGGYVKPKITITGRIKLLLRKPYVPKHWKLVRKINPYYLNIPPAALAETHLPVHPMWQLNYFTVSIKEFEEKNYPSQDTTFYYPFEEKIRQYSGLQEEDQFLMIGNEGYDFNPKNNYNKGIGHLKCANAKCKKLIKPEIGPEEKITRSQVVISQSDEAITYLRRFISDNKNLNKKTVDSLRAKHKQVITFINQHKSISKRKINEKNLKIKLNTRQNNLTDVHLARKEQEETRNTDNRNFYKIQYSKKEKNNQELIKALHARIDSNTIAVSKLDEVLPEIIKEEHPTITMTKDSLLIYQKYKKDLIKYAILIDLGTNDKNDIKAIHLHIDLAQKKLNELEKDFIKAEKLYAISNYRSRDSICQVAMRKINENKKLIIQLKKIKTEKGNEEELYKEQNKILKYWYKEYRATHQDKKLKRNINNTFFHTWERIINKTYHILDDYKKSEKYLISQCIRSENYRCKKYNYAGSKAIIAAVNLKKKSQNMIINSKKLIKIKRSK